MAAEEALETGHRIAPGRPAARLALWLLVGGLGAIALQACPASPPRAVLPAPVRLVFSHRDHLSALEPSCAVCHTPRTADRTRGRGDMGLVADALCRRCHVESAAVRREARPARLARTPRGAGFEHARHAARLDRRAPGATCRTCHRFPPVGAAAARDLVVQPSVCAGCHDG